VPDSSEPKVNSNVAQAPCAKRKRLEETDNPKPLCKEQITVEVLKSELERNKTATAKNVTKVELMKAQTLAAAAKKNYYDLLAAKVQLETALIVSTNNVQFVQAENRD
jgi:hypothetical protein